MQSLEMRDDVCQLLTVRPEPWCNAYFRRAKVLPSCNNVASTRLRVILFASRKIDLPVALSLEGGFQWCIPRLVTVTVGLWKSSQFQADDMPERNMRVSVTLSAANTSESMDHSTPQVDFRTRVSLCPGCFFADLSNQSVNFAPSTFRNLR